MVEFGLFCVISWYPNLSRRVAVYVERNTKNSRNYSEERDIIDVHVKEVLKEEIPFYTVEYSFWRRISVSKERSLKWDKRFLRNNCWIFSFWVFMAGWFVWKEIEFLSHSFSERLGCRLNTVFHIRCTYNWQTRSSYNCRKYELKCTQWFREG